MNCCALALILSIAALVLFIWVANRLTEPQLLSPDKDLPEGAKKYRGPRNHDLKETQEERLEFYRETGRVLSLPDGAFDNYAGALSSSRDRAKEHKRDVWQWLFGSTSPIVDGTRWFQAFAVCLGGGNWILLYESFVVDQSNPRPYLICTLGDVFERDIDEFVEVLKSQFKKKRERMEDCLQQIAAD